MHLGCFFTAEEAAVQEAQPATAAKGGVAMGSVASEVVNEA